MRYTFGNKRWFARHGRSWRWFFVCSFCTPSAAVGFRARSACCGWFACHRRGKTGIVDRFSWVT